MTDAPPPSIPPSIPPRKRPSASTGARAVTTVPGRGGSATQTNGTARVPRGDAKPPAPARRGPGPTTTRPRDEQPVPTPFPVVAPPGEEDVPEGPSPLAVAVEQSEEWLKKAASAAGSSLSAAYASLTRPRPKDDPMTANPQAPGALPRTVPPTAPAITAGAPTVRPATGRAPGPRRVRLAISRLDPWSVMKLAFLLSFAAGIVLVVAVSVLWLTLDGLHVFTSVNDLVTQIVGTESSINILTYVQFSKVLSVTTLIAVIDVFLLTALATIGAFLYNVVAALVGGVHVTMTDE
jgi:hypothetical protein